MLSDDCINNIGNQNIQDNFGFYSSAKGQEILNSKNFTFDIVDFLESEYQMVHSILNQNLEKYDSLLEVGCGAARNLELSISLGLQYFGIDFIEREVHQANLSVANRKVFGKVKCLSLMELNCSTTPVPLTNKTVCLLPFNVFGNVFNPLAVMEIMCDLNYDVLISTYRNDVMLAPIIDYYRACGLLDIKTTPVKNGVLFSSTDGFSSIIYHEEYFHTMAKQTNLQMTSTNFSKLGKQYYFYKKEWIK